MLCSASTWIILYFVQPDSCKAIHLILCSYPCSQPFQGDLKCFFNMDGGRQVAAVVRKNGDIECGAVEVCICIV